MRVGLPLVDIIRGVFMGNEPSKPVSEIPPSAKDTIASQLSPKTVGGPQFSASMHAGQATLHDNAVLQQNTFPEASFAGSSNTWNRPNIYLSAEGSAGIIANATQPYLPDIIGNLKRSALVEISSDSTILQGLSLYVPLEGASYANAKTGTNIEEQVKTSFLCQDNAAKIFLLQGNSGAGKSLFGRYLENVLWEQYAPESYIPLFVSLPVLQSKHPQSLQGHLLEMALKEKGLADSLITHLKSAQLPIFLILDGYDETGTRGNLYQDNHLSEWNVKVMITCRSQYLAGDYVEQFVQIGADRKIIPDTLLERYLVPFDQGKLLEYICRYASKAVYNKVGWSKEKYLEALDSIANWQEIAKEPFILGTLLSILPSLRKSEVTQQTKRTLTRSEIYDEFIKQWFEKEYRRLKEKGNEFSRYIEQKLPNETDERRKQFIFTLFKVYSAKLAHAMLVKNQQVVEAPTLVQEVDAETLEDNQTITGEWLEFFYDSDTDKQAKLRIGLVGSPLKRIGAHHFLFIHKSFYEYFVAQRILEELLGKNGNEQYLHLNKKLLTGEPAIIEFLAEYVKREDPKYAPLTGILFAIIRQSKTNPALRREDTCAAANAITILSYALVPFNEQDFDNIYIQHADLSGAIIEQCTFVQANLKSVRFEGAWVRDCAFTDALMDDIILKDSFKTRNVTGTTNVFLSADGDQTISLQDNTVTFWSNITKQPSAKHKEATGTILSAQFMPEENYMLILTALSEAGYSFNMWDFNRNVIKWTLNVQRKEIVDDDPTKTKHSNFFASRLEVEPNRAVLYSFKYREENMQFAYAAKSHELALMVGDQLYIGIVSNTEGNRTSYRKRFSDYVYGSSKIYCSNKGNFFAWTSRSSVHLYKTREFGKRLQLYSSASEEIERFEHYPGADILAFSQDDAYLGISCSGAVKILDLASDHCVATLSSEQEKATSLAFSSDNKWLAVGHNNSDIRVWSINEQQCVRILRNAGNVMAYNTVRQQLIVQDGLNIVSVPLSKSAYGTRAAHTTPIINLVIERDTNTVAVSSYEQRKSEFVILTSRFNIVLGECLSVSVQEQYGSQEIQAAKAWQIKALRTLSSYLENIPAWLLSIDLTTISFAAYDDNILITGHINGSVKCWKLNEITNRLSLQWRDPIHDLHIENAKLHEDFDAYTPLSKLQTMLLCWIEAEDVARVLEMLQYAKEEEVSEALLNYEGKIYLTPLAFAVQKRLSIVVKILLLESSSQSKFDIISGFVSADNIEGLKYLFGQGVSIEEVSKDTEQTALHLAAELGRFKTLEFLLRSGANTEAIDKAGKRPIHYAVSLGDLLPLRALIDNKVELNSLIEDDDGKFALQLAIEQRNKQASILLVESGVNFACCNRRAQTAAHVAARVRDWDILMLLLSKGYRLTAKDNMKDALATSAQSFPVFGRFLLNLEGTQIGLPNNNYTNRNYIREVVLRTIVEHNKNKVTISQACNMHALACEIALLYGKEYSEFAIILNAAEQLFLRNINSPKHDLAQVYYANFLCSQGHYNKALPILQSVAVKNGHRIEFSDLTRWTIPIELEREMDFHGIINISAQLFVFYMQLVACKELKLISEACQSLQKMRKIVSKSSNPLEWSLLGYAAMYLRMYGAAHAAFGKACHITIKPPYVLAEKNKQRCEALMVADEEIFAATTIQLEWKKHSLRVRPHYNFDYSNIEEYLETNIVEDGPSMMRQIAAKSTSARDLNSSGDSLYEMGCYQQALRFYNKALELVRLVSEEGLPSKEIPEFLLNSGIALQSLGRYEDALINYNEAISIHKEDKTSSVGAQAICLEWQAIALAGLNRLPEAIEALKLSLTIANSNNTTRLLAQAYSLQALNLKNAADFVMAERYYKQSIQYDNNVAAHVYYGGFLYLRGMLKEAINEWKFVLTLATQNVAMAPRALAIGSVILDIQQEIKSHHVYCTTSTILVHLSLLLAYQELQRIDEAQSHLVLLIETIDSVSPSYCNFSALGYAYRALGKIEEAIGAFTKAINAFRVKDSQSEYVLAQDNINELTSRLKVANAENFNTCATASSLQIHTEVGSNIMNYETSQITSFPSSIPWVSVVKQTSAAVQNVAAIEL